MEYLVYGIWIYAVVINIVGFIEMKKDKEKAVKKKYRTPERTLFLIAILGGSIGSIMGMYFFRHKTKHKRFVVGMPAIAIIQGIILITAGKYI